MIKAVRTAYFAARTEIFFRRDLPITGEISRTKSATGRLSRNRNAVIALRELATELTFF